MFFLPFRSITRGRMRRARWTALFVFLGALALYVLTLTTYAFPGESSSWIAWAAGLDSREVPTHSILIAVGNWVSGLPFLTLAIRMNLLSAIAGALIVSSVYKMVWFFVFETMREQSAVAHASRNAQFGGLVAALAVGVNMPFWLAATRFRPEIFEIAMLAACAHLLIVYACSPRWIWMLLFGALYGAGVAESPMFMVAAPFMAALAVIVEWKLAWCRLTRLSVSAWLALVSMVGVYYVSARWFAQANGTDTGLHEIFRLCVWVLRDQFGALHRMVPGFMWMPVIALGIGAAALSFFSSFRALDNRRSWSQLFLNLTLTLAAALLLANVPFSPWGVLAPQGILPAATYVLAGIGIGLLAASWRALTVLSNPVDVENSLVDTDRSTSRPPAVFTAGRMAGSILAPLLVGLILVTGIWNGFRNRADRGDFIDRAADALLSELHGRTWVVANGLMDANLLIRAHERKIPVRLLCPYRAAERTYTASILRSIQQDQSVTENARLRAGSLIAYNFHMFIDDLFSTDTRIGTKAVAMGLPDIWYGTGWTPVPESLFYGGVREIGEVKDRGLLAERRIFWEAWRGFIKEGLGSRRQQSYRHRVALRKHLAFLANNLGVTLGDLGRPVEAFEAYQQARAIDPENISALLNVFEMTSRGYHPEMKAAIDRELRRKVEGTSRRYSLWSLSRYYGYVRNYEMFVQMGWSWALSSTPGSILAGLRSVYSLQQDEDKRAALAAMMASIYEMRGDYAQSAAEYRKTMQRDPKNTSAISGLVRLALQQSVVTEARKILESGEAAGAPKRMLRQDWAALYLVSGDLPRARIVLQELADEPDASPMTLAMLAMVMIEQKEVASVEAVLLPKLVKAANGKDSYFAQVVQGRVWQSKGKAWYRNARVCFQRAATIRPDVQALQEVILMLDVAMEDQVSAEAHALAILRQQPNHPFANFILGSIRLEQGQYGDSETYLRRSAEAPEPTLAALNNFAQVLCRIRKLAEAEEVARKATERAPDRYEGWSTLAFVLATRDRLGQAADALGKARLLNNTDSRVFLVEAMIASKRGDLTGAEKAIDSVGPEKKLTVADRRELRNVSEEIARLRRQRGK